MVEGRHGLCRVVMFGIFSVAWLKKLVEKLVRLPEETEFVDSPREGNRAFIAQKVDSNRAYRFLDVAEYTVGGHHGLIVVLEGCGRWGWKIFAAELGKVAALFDSSLGKNNVVLLRQHLEDSSGSIAMSTDKERSYLLVNPKPTSDGGGRDRARKGSNVEGCLFF